MTTINEIQARISKYGTVSPNRFIVEFKAPAVLLNLLGPLGAERLAIQCEATSLPGKSFSTKEVKIYGPQRKLPYVATFTNALELSFRVGTDFRERSIFDEWQALVMNPQTNMFGYQNEYTTELVIHQLNQADERIYSVALSEAWPEAIAAVALSSAARSTYETQGITFAFYTWKDVTKDPKYPPFSISSTTTVKKAQGGLISTLIQRGVGAFFDQLPRITGSGGTLFGSTLNKNLS